MPARSFLRMCFKLASLRDKVANRAQYLLHRAGGIFTFTSQRNQFRDLDKTLEKDTRG